MEVQEHFYTDDPARAPADATTTLPGVNYLFLGNGLIQAAVQICPRGPATPVGLLIMDPERLGPKRKALTFDPGSGLRETMILLAEGGTVHKPKGRYVRARWMPTVAMPVVEVNWRSGDFRVEELFFCPDEKTPRLHRRVTAYHGAAGKTMVRLKTRAGASAVELPMEFDGKSENSILLEYRIVRKSGTPVVELLEADGTGDVPGSAPPEWSEAAILGSSDPALESFFNAAKFQLRAAVARSGKLDGGIWQYNLEWVRDQAFIAMGLTMAGRPDIARTILDRLFREFVSPEGATLDSSRLRSWQESEFDQNGVLLFALETYVNWTGDTAILSHHWEKIIKAARFPLKATFRHPDSGLLRNRREFWERHSAHGIRDGMELAHQLFVSMGLSAASRLAARLGDNRNARAWRLAGEQLRRAMLAPGGYGLVENGRFIKRRDGKGSVQRTIRPAPDLGFPAGMPLFAKGRHWINPDSSAALPIAWEFIDPTNVVAHRTLAWLETLWNQRWKGGGYGRYHVTSEPDSPGPWPFASLFIARAWFEAGDDPKVRSVLEWLGRLPGARAGSWFEFYGPRPVPPYPQVGIVPWVWAELIFLVIHHMLGVRPAENSLKLRTRLLTGVDSLDASLRLRGGRLDIAARRARAGEKPGYIIGDSFHPFRKNGIELDFPKDSGTIRVEAVLPRAGGA